MITKTSGWNEWADKRVSLYRGCTSGCRYCFARADALRFGRIKTAAEWDTPVLNEKEYARKPARCRGVIGCFGTHDITPENVETCEAYLKNLLDAGNHVLIVTKPSPRVVERLCRSLLAFREQVEWRMTITAMRDDLLRCWEPGAPNFSERFRALRLALAAGYRTSVSIEPMLDVEHTPLLVKELRTVNPETIWIGKMSRVRQRVRYRESDLSDFGAWMPLHRAVERIEAGQTDERIMEVVRALKDEPRVRWKDSIQDVIDRQH